MSSPNSQNVEALLLAIRTYLLLVQGGDEKTGRACSLDRDRDSILRRIDAALAQPYGPADTETPEELRMVIGYLAGELQIAGDHRSTPEIVFNAVSAVKRSSATSSSEAGK